MNLTIDPRYCGPPNSANGGYISGMLGQLLPGTAQVTLRKPPPLGKEMQIVMDILENANLPIGKEYLAA